MWTTVEDFNGVDGIISTARLSQMTTKQNRSLTEEAACKVQNPCFLGTVTP